MKELILHFGVHRTGSTSIQQAMANSRGILRSHGILYPQLFGMGNHVKIPWWLKNKKISSQELLEEVERCDEDIVNKIIISAEDFCILHDFSFIDTLKEKYRVSVVLYLKEQVAWLESWYNQHVKWPWSPKFSGSTPDFFLDSVSDFFWIEYDGLLKRIEKYMKPADLNVHVAGVGGVKDTVNHFLSIADIDPRWLNKFEDLNQSLTTARLDILRRIDIQPLSWPARRRIIQSLEEMEIDEDDGRKVIFSSSQVDFIVDKYSGSNKKVAKKYFGRDALFVTPERNGVAPSFVNDDKAYQYYIPKLLKMIAQKDA